MSLWWTLLIVAAMPPAPNASAEPASVTVFHSGFEPEPGEEADEWPVGWTRRRGVGFPAYVSVAVTDESAVEGKHCLKVSLNGGGAAVYSPRIHADHLSTFTLAGMLKTAELVHDRAFLSLTFLDADDRPLDVFHSELRQATHDWSPLAIRSCFSPNDRVAWVVIGLHVEPQDGRQDIRGFAWFDRLQLNMRPREVIELPDAIHLYRPGQAIAVRCRYLRHVDSNVKVELQVVDPFGEIVEPPRAIIAPQALDGSATVHWRGTVQFRDAGFYRLRVALIDDQQRQHIEETTLAILSPHAYLPRGEFGWTMPQGEGTLPLGELARLLRESGVTRIKFPLWVGNDRQRIEKLVEFAKETRLGGVEIIGLLADPPREYLNQLALHTRPNASKLFRNPPQSWLPTLDPLLMRMSWQVAGWQLGADRDTSLPSMPELLERLTEIKQHLDLVGHDVSIALPWSWLAADPSPQLPADKLPWRIAAVSDATLETVDDLTHQLDQLAAGQLPRWLSLEPTGASPGDLTQRINHLVERLLVAKARNATGIFINAPMRERGGLLRPDGAPAELFLPWRTTAIHLSGTQYLGQITLPNRSRNHAFARDGQVTLVVSGGEPTRETLYLGEDVQLTDVWGQSSKPPQDGLQQQIEVGSLPLFITGVNEAVTRWRLSARLADRSLPSRFGVRQRSAVLLANTLGQRVTGTLRIVAPREWRVVPDRFDLELEAGQEVRLPITWSVPLNGTSDPQNVQFDFELHGSRTYEFSAYDAVEVGHGDLKLDAVAQINGEGNLVVEQRITNDTGRPLSFRCYLYVPGQRRIRAQANSLGPGENTYRYTVPNGRELIGQTLWIRAEDFNGTRVLSHRFTIKSPDR